MKNPPHPGRLIAENIVELGLSVTKAATGMGITRQHLYKVIKGDCGISPEMAVRLEQAIGSTAEAWLRMQNAYDLAQVRQYDGKIVIRRFSLVNTPQP